MKIIKLFIVCIITLMFATICNAETATNVWKRPVVSDPVLRPNTTNLYTLYQCNAGEGIYAPINMHEVSRNVYIGVLNDKYVKIGFFGAIMFPTVMSGILQGQYLGYCTGPLKVVVQNITNESVPLVIMDLKAPTQSQFITPE